MASRYRRGMRILSTLAIDVVLVIAFAAIGRISHGETLSPAELGSTAWPFVVAAIVGSLVATWRRGTWWVQGLTAWSITLVGGMLLRLASGASVALGFVAVTSLVLAVFLIGWRWLARRRLT